MANRTPKRVSLWSTLHDSVCVLFRNGLTLVALVVVLDFLIWGLAIELPAKYWTYLLWRVPPLVALGGLFPELEWLPTLFATDQNSARLDTSSRIVHAALYLVAVLNVSILVLHGSLSLRNVIDHVIQKVKTWAFFRDLCRTICTMVLFVLAAMVGTGTGLVLVSAVVQAVASRDRVILLVVLSVVVVAGVNVILSRWLLIAPICTLEGAGIQSFARSWKYTKDSPVEVWVLYMIHTVVLILVVLLIPDRLSNEIWTLFFNAILPICIVWHSALSVTCYRTLCSESA